MIAHPDDAAAWQGLFDITTPRLWVILRRAGAARSELDDLIQEVMLKVVHAARTRSQISNFDAWLVRTAKNVAIDAARRSARSPVSFFDLLPVSCEADYGPADHVERERFTELLVAARECFDALPDRAKMIVTFCWLDGHTYDEAESLFHVPKGTISRWLAALRQQGLRRVAEIIDHQPGKKSARRAGLDSSS